MEIKKQFEILKKADEEQLVFGWASIAKDRRGDYIVDFQGDVIEPDELEKAAYDYVLNSRQTGEGHNPNLRGKGYLVESMVFTKEKQKILGIPDGAVPEGWFVGFHIDDENAWSKIKKGDYLMFSIEGTGERIPIKEESNG